MTALQSKADRPEEERDAPLPSAEEQARAIAEGWWSMVDIYGSIGVNSLPPCGSRSPPLYESGMRR